MNTAVVYLDPAETIKTTGPIVAIRLFVITVYYSKCMFRSNKMCTRVWQNAKTSDHMQQRYGVQGQFAWSKQPTYCDAISNFFRHRYSRFARRVQFWHQLRASVEHVSKSKPRSFSVLTHTTKILTLTRSYYGCIVSKKALPPKASTLYYIHTEQKPYIYIVKVNLCRFRMKVDSTKMF